jgi:predicted metal-dependent phosphoesterase TrpH
LDIDIHVHTTASICSQFSPQDLVNLAVKRNLPVVVTTNHHNPYGDTKYLRRELGKRGILYIPGIEISTSWGDFLLFGEDLDDFIQRKERFPVDRLPNPEIAVIWAHPYRYYSDAYMEEIKWKVNDYIDAVEVINGNCIIQGCPEANVKSMEMAKLFNKPAVAGSDTHSRPMFYLAWTEFLEPVSSYSDFVRCLKEGRVRPVENREPNGFRFSCRK